LDLELKLPDWYAEMEEEEKRTAAASAALTDDIPAPPAQTNVCNDGGTHQQTQYIFFDD
jgi:hypothetical protein